MSKDRKCLEEMLQYFDSPESICGIIDHFGEPLYLYNFDITKNRCSALQSNLPDNVDIYYSLKANSSLGIAARIKEYVSGAEVSSEGELMTALKAGFKPSQLIFVGPGKSEQALKAAIQAQIRAIVVESRDEINMLVKLSYCSTSNIPIFFRLNPNFSASGTRLTMSGVSSQFGINAEEASALIPEILKKDNLRIIGLHIYLGTRILKSEHIAENTLNILKMCEELEDHLGYDFECIDIGGGLGVDYFENETPLDLVDLKARLTAIFASGPKRRLQRRYVLETGRYLMADSGIYATKVLSTKWSRGKHYVLTSGGTNHFFANNYLSSFRKRSFPISILNKLKAKEFVKSTICGPLCTPSDILASDVNLAADVEVGDTIGIFKAGAYGFSLGLMNFLSHFSPAEVLVEKKSAQLIRNHGNVEYLFQNQMLNGPRIELNKNDSNKVLKKTF